jgi:hypothetical protein
MPTIFVFVFQGLRNNKEAATGGKAPSASIVDGHVENKGCSLSVEN